MKVTFKKIVGYLLVVWAILLAFFVVSMTAVYCIPNTLVQKNALSSATCNELDEKAISPDNPKTEVSSSTVSIMLSMASHGGEDPLRDAMRGSYYRQDDLSVHDSVRQGINKDANRTYEYYWHGWMIILKPLLIFTDYDGIKKFCWVCFFILLSLVCVSLCKAVPTGVFYSVALCFAFVLAGKNGIDCFPYNLPILLALGACLFVLHTLKNKSLSDAELALLIGYFVIGALTTFLDFLITPLLTLLLPLICLILVSAPKVSVRQLGITCIRIGVVWVFGYLGLWVSKWALASFMLGINVFEMGITQVLFRVNVDGVISHGFTEPINTSGGVAINFVSSIGKNIVAMFPGKSLIVALGFALIAAVVSIASLLNGKSKWYIVAALAVCALLPYLWYAVVANHSMIHYYFTFRLQIAAVYAVLSLFAYCIACNIGTGAEKN